MVDIIQAVENLDNMFPLWDGGSSRVWSLLDMLRVYANNFINIGGTFALIRNYLYTAESQNLPIPDKLKDQLKSDLIKLKNECGTMRLTVSSAILSSKIDKLPVSHHEVKMMMDVINEEIKQKLFILISADRASHYNPDKPIWGVEITDKFPDMVDDIIEANNCYALNRHTACVFHLMRIMEKSVQKLGNKIGLSSSFTYNEEWQTIINAIRGQIKTLYPKGGNSDRIKYESNVGHLETIKIAWRNPTMHPKATYTEEEAKSLLSAVAIFLKELIKVL